MIFGIGVVVLCAAAIIGHGSFANPTALQATETQTVQTDPIRKEVPETSSLPRSAEGENAAKEDKGVFEPTTLENQGGENNRGGNPCSAPNVGTAKTSKMNSREEIRMNFKSLAAWNWTGFAILFFAFLIGCGGMSGGMNERNAAQANTAIGRYFNVSDILATRPMDPTANGSGASATQDMRNYGMTMGAISQYAKDVGMTHSSGMVTAMMNDASDMRMGGMMAGGDERRNDGNGKRSGSNGRRNDERYDDGA